MSRFLDFVPFCEALQRLHGFVEKLDIPEESRGDHCSAREHNTLYALRSLSGFGKRGERKRGILSDSTASLGPPGGF